MDGLLKALIAAACVVVIAIGGHYGYTLYSARQERIAAEQAAVRKAIARAEAAKARAEEELLADCNRRVPSQATETLKRLYQQCLDDNRGFYAVAD